MCNVKVKAQDVSCGGGQPCPDLCAPLLRHLHAITTTGQRQDPVIATGGKPAQS